MQQILQNLKTGTTEVVHVPSPCVTPGQLLIRTCASLVSAGTERMLVEFGRANPLEKARSQPERVRQVLDKVRTDGLVPTLEAVRHKLDQPLALGYCNAGVVLEMSSGKADGARQWGFGFAIARTWKTVEGQSLKHLVTHVPHKYYQCTRVPREGRKDRKTFWTYSTCLGLRHGGDVPVVLSKKGRNTGPQHTKILGANLAALTPSQVVCIYQKRWAIALVNWALKSGLGLGEHQVSGATNRSEKSVGIAVLASVLVLRV